MLITIGNKTFSTWSVNQHSSEASNTYVFVEKETGRILKQWDLRGKIMKQSPIGCSYAPMTDIDFYIGWLEIGSSEQQSTIIDRMHKIIDRMHKIPDKILNEEIRYINDDSITPYLCGYLNEDRRPFADEIGAKNTLGSIASNFRNYPQRKPSDHHKNKKDLPIKIKKKIKARLQELEIQPFFHTLNISISGFVDTGIQMVECEGAIPVHRDGFAGSRTEMWSSIEHRGIPSQTSTMTFLVSSSQLQQFQQAMEKTEQLKEQKFPTAEEIARALINELGTQRAEAAAAKLLPKAAPEITAAKG